MKMGAPHPKHLVEAAQPSELHPGPLGELLVQAGSMSVEDVDRVLEVQRGSGQRFGEVAMNLSLVRFTDLQRALSHQFAFSYVHGTPDAARISTHLVSACRPFSPEADQFRAIRSHLMLRWLNKDRQQNVLCVLGCDGGEGRSHVAANLAVVFAQAGKRTLLIDADLRHPTQHELFGVRPGKGLSSLLAGYLAGDVLQPINGLHGLYLLAAGVAPPNPLELLSRPALADQLYRAGAEFDVVILDTAALSSGADAEFVAARAESALFVARTGLTKVASLSRSVRGMTSAGVRVAGVVWNDRPQPCALRLADAVEARRYVE